MLHRPAGALERDGPLTSLQGYNKLNAVIISGPVLCAGTVGLVGVEGDAATLPQAEPLTGHNKVAHGSRSLSKELARDCSNHTGRVSDSSKAKWFQHARRAGLQGSLEPNHNTSGGGKQEGSRDRGTA